MNEQTAGRKDANNGGSIKSMTLEELESVMADLGEPRFRAKQVHEWLHSHNASSFDDMTNLPKPLREKLQERFPLGKSHIVEIAVADDGTRKYLLELDDGLVVEMVGIFNRDVKGGEVSSSEAENNEEGAHAAAVSEEVVSFSDLNRKFHSVVSVVSHKNTIMGPPADLPDDARLTVCCSSQVGCAMQCSFCATGMQGLERSLTADEIVDQVYKVGSDMGIRVSNVVIMGQGEPFQNYDEVLSAIRRINSDAGLGVGARHITVSTSGIIDEIYRFAEEPEQFRLAVSLHSAVQKTRDKLMPRQKNQPLSELREAISHYCETKGRRVTLEFMLLDGVNDSDAELSALVDFCKGLNVHVNLLPYNEVEDAQYSPSHRNIVNHWSSVLSENGISSTVRRSKGSDISGACGQLKESKAKKYAFFHGRDN